MERYEACSELQKKILDELYVYLGFNEITSFENFIKFVFYNARSGINFECVVNHTLAHIVKSFNIKHPEYDKNYMKYFWLNTNDMLEHMKVGSNIEYDPKGVLRHFVKENFDYLSATKR